MHLTEAQASRYPAESCTGGGIAQAMTAMPGSSAWFERGMVSYSNDAKQDLLGVQAQTLASHGAVSEAVALEMARGAIDMLGMLEEKTRGNLTTEEDKLLRELLNQVRLNYVSEQDKPDTAPEATADAAATDSGATGADADSPSSESNEASSDEKASQD